jgi:N-acetylglucosaminyldiphosphoundecaprenol N-acetyl-beta-D-mannosaminyltransferase
MTVVTLKRSDTLKVLGIEVDATNLTDAADSILGWIARGQRETVTVAAVHSIVDAQRVPEAKRMLQQCGLCVPDGVPLVWLLKLAGRKNVSRVFGADLMVHLSKRMAARKLSAFYYGGRPDVVEELAQSMSGRFPGLKTAGYYSPPFRELSREEEDGIVSMINGSGADVVWVGLGAPKQECWMRQFRDRLTAPVLVGVGAAFDYNTNRLARAPLWMQACALEWLYRMILEPQRLWRRYLRNNPLFVYYLLCELSGLRTFD